MENFIFCAVPLILFVLIGMVLNKLLLKTSTSADTLEKTFLLNNIMTFPLIGN